MLVIYCQTWDLPLRMVNVPNGTPLQKIDFFFAIGCHFQIVSWLGMGTHFHFQLFQCCKTTLLGHTASPVLAATV